jgi:4-amino-4-deoxy-L-arabinose transferase-like glycosyltransferase
VELRRVRDLGLAGQVNFWLLALAGLTALRLVLAATIPLSPDEIYYWLWSVDPQPGYFDHPPMVAYWIRAGTGLFGNTPLGVRFFGPVAAALGSVLLWDAGEHLWPKRHAGLIAASLFNATIILGVGAIVMTPDTPLVFFWTAALAALGRLLASKDARWWLAVGAAAGAGLLSKYTALLLMVSIFFWLVTQAEGRAALRTVWPWAGLALAGAIFAPDFVWNAAHGWVSFFKQGGRVAGFDLGRSADYLGELVAGQIGLATPIVFTLATAGLWRIRRLAEPRARLLLWVTLLPAAVFLEHVLTGRVEANWPAVVFPGAALAASYLPETVMAVWLRPALGTGFGLTLLVYAQAVAAPFPLAAGHDPAALQLAGWQELADQITTLKPDFITSDDYAIASELAFHTPADVTVTGFDRRWTYFDLPRAPVAAGAFGIMVTRRQDAPCPVSLGEVTRRDRGQVVMSYKLCRFAATPNMALLPHP